jgi:hypothetical protein
LATMSQLASQLAPGNAAEVVAETIEKYSKNDQRA